MALYRPANQGIVLAHSAVGVPSTNTTSEEVAATIAVPANAMGANGFLVIDTTWTLTSSANNKTMRVRFGASGAGTGGTAISAPVATTNAGFRDIRIISNRNATNSQVGSASSASGGGVGGGGAAPPTAAIDTTAAAEVVITSQKATGTETLTLEQYTVWLYYRP